MGFFNFFKKEVPKPKPTVPAVKTVTVEDMKLFPNIGYDITNIKLYNNTPNSDPSYLIEGINLNKAREDLKKINSIIKEHAKTDKIFSRFSIDVATARFSSEGMKSGHDDFCCLFCSPTTKSGKPAKFPLSMRIAPLSSDEVWKRESSKTGKTIHGRIYYLADGSIGKVEIYCWQGGNGYFIKENYTLKKKN